VSKVVELMSILVVYSVTVLVASCL